MNAEEKRMARWFLIFGWVLGASFGASLVGLIVAIW